MLGVLVFFLIALSLALSLRASRATRAAKRAAASAAQAQRLVAELRSATAAPVARVALTKPRAPGRAELNAVLHTELVQVLGRRAAAELSSRPAPVDAVPASAPVDAVPWSARPRS